MKALVISSAVFALLLGAMVGLFMVSGDPLGGEPRALLLIDSTKRPVTGRQSTATREATPSIPQPGPAIPAMPDPSAAQPSAPQERTRVAIVPPGTPVTLAAVPDKALVEDSRYGPLPKIAPDGRRPSEIYARPATVSPRPQPGDPARIALLVNGLGLSQQVTTTAITKLPAPVTLALSPYGRNLQNWVRQARAAGHEVMLQIPLEPFDYPDNDPGPQTLLTSLTPEENQKRLLWLLARFTGYTGITNHMGAKFAAAQEVFLPVLEELRSRGLIYLDDGTSARSTAGSIARELGLGFSVAQVHVDADKTREGIDEALAKLENAALENGFAIGVGTSLPVTIERISDWAKKLEEKGIVLIPVSAAIHAKHQS